MKYKTGENIAEILIIKEFTPIVTGYIVVDCETDRKLKGWVDNYETYNKDNFCHKIYCSREIAQKYSNYLNKVWEDGGLKNRYFRVVEVFMDRELIDTVRDLLMYFDRSWPLLIYCPCFYRDSQR